jgi:peroxiredoxin
MQTMRWTIFIGLLMALAGCGSGEQTAAKSDTKSAGASQPAADLTAQQILKRLLETYRGAKSYADEAVVRLHYVQQGQGVDQEWKSSVRLARPNKLALDAFQAVVRCDGRELRARIEDPLTGNVDNQVLVRPAPKELALKDLASDPLLYDIIASRLRRQPIQLELLLESSGLAAAFGKDIACQRLEGGVTDGRDCFRVEVPSPGGAFVFWIDQERFLLRKLDYPAAALVPQLAADTSVSDLALWAELREPRLDGPVEADAFTLELPAGAKKMKTLVVPPLPLPSKLFGQRPDDFFFTTLDDGKVTRQDLAGKVTLLVWYRHHEACRATLAEVAKVRQEFAENEKVAIYAVSTDPTTESNEDLTQLLKNWQVELPLVRDLEAFGNSIFHIEAQPTVVVLDAQGRVQIFQPGGNPELAAQLATILTGLLRGEDMAAEIVRRAAAERDEYERLVAAGGPQPSRDGAARGGDPGPQPAPETEAARAVDEPRAQIPRQCVRRRRGERHAPGGLRRSAGRGGAGSGWKTSGASRARSARRRRGHLPAHGPRRRREALVCGQCPAGHAALPAGRPMADEADLSRGFFAGAGVRRATGGPAGGRRAGAVRRLRRRSGAAHGVAGGQAAAEQ